MTYPPPDDAALPADSPYTPLFGDADTPAAPAVDDAALPAEWSSADLPWYRRDPVWLLFVVLLICFFGFVLTSIIAAVGGDLIARATIVSTAPDTEDAKATPALYRSSLLFSLSVFVPQLMMVIPALAAVLLMAEPTRRRLGLVRGNWPLWLWPIAALATLTVGLFSGLLVQWLIQPWLGESRSLSEMTGIFRSLGQGGGLLPLALVIGVTPGIFEELLFRGYLQTGLTRRWGAYAGIFAASVLFAVFHLDPVHACGVLLIGIYLGWVYWASGSLFPAMLGHFFNNFFSVVAMVSMPQLDQNQGDLAAQMEVTLPMVLLGLGVLTSFVSLALTVPAALFFRRR